jgi:hypothetical protein
MIRISARWTDFTGVVSLQPKCKVAALSYLRPTIAHQCAQPAGDLQCLRGLSVSPHYCKYISWLCAVLIAIILGKHGRCSDSEVFHREEEINVRCVLETRRNGATSFPLLLRLPCCTSSLLTQTTISKKFHAHKKRKINVCCLRGVSVRRSRSRWPRVLCVVCWWIISRNFESFTCATTKESSRTMQVPGGTVISCGFENFPTCMHERLGWFYSFCSALASLEVAS